MSTIEERISLPKSTSAFARTSVMVLDKEMRGGGSGVILKSSAVESEILTNKHVCKLVENGGYVMAQNEPILVEAIKKYPYHDLCLILVRRGLGVTTSVAKNPPPFFKRAYISGHPGLLPHVLTTGNFSGKENIELIVGLKKCNSDTPDREYIYCVFFGGIPVIQSFASQLVTGTILPGSSGSAVFDDNGEIAGLVFAGRGRGLGYAFIVPHEYIVHFLKIQNQIKYRVVNRTKYSDLIYRIFSAQQKCDKTLKGICRKLLPNAIQRLK